LLAQVKSGGRITSGLIEDNVVRLASGLRSAGGYGLTSFADMDCVPLPGFQKPRGFTF
jgi:protein-L-isoaspartate(D-aspartate) O-methyltransferase